MSQTFTQADEMDEGQEEWLSEEMLTDEDCNQTIEQDGSDSALGRNSQMDSSQDNTNLTSQETSDKIDDSNIEQTLNSFDSERQHSDLPAELDDFLIRKPAVKKKETVKNKEEEESDGNDTDDLLRMLEDDDKSKKTKVLTHRKEKRSKPSSDDDDDDEFIFEGQQAQKLKVAKSVLVRKYPAARAMPENTSDSDESSDEASTVKKMFSTKRLSNVASKSTARQVKTQVVRVIGNKKGTPKAPTTASTPKPSARNASKQYKAKVPNGQLVVKQIVRHVHANNKVVDKAVDRIVTVKPDAEVKKPTKPDSWQDHEEIINEEEFLEEDDFDLDEDFAEESDSELDRRAVKQRIMRPEQVDEEMLSDVESLSEEFSDFNEFGSCNSDNDEDWFSLDIRNERAGDYLPMLGTKAYELLLEEKKRVSLRLESLKESLASLSESGKSQSEKLRGATAELAEIDASLRAC